MNNNFKQCASELIKYDSFKQRDDFIKIYVVYQDNAEYVEFINYDTILILSPPTYNISYYFYSIINILDSFIKPYEY